MNYLGLHDAMLIMGGRGDCTKMIGQAVSQCTHNCVHSLGNEGPLKLWSMLSEKLPRLVRPHRGRMGYVLQGRCSPVMGSGHVQGCYRRREGLAQAMSAKANRPNNTERRYWR